MNPVPYWALMSGIIFKMIEYLKKERTEAEDDGEEWRIKIRLIRDPYDSLGQYCDYELADGNRWPKILSMLEQIRNEFKTVKDAQSSRLKQYFRTRKVYRKWYKAFRNARIYAKLHLRQGPPKENEALEDIINRFLPNNTPAT